MIICDTINNPDIISKDLEILTVEKIINNFRKTHNLNILILNMSTFSNCCMICKTVSL